MGPLFIIPKHEEEEDDTPPQNDVSNQRSTPEGQEPDRNEREQPTPPPQQQTKKKREKSKKFESITATTHHHHHHRYSLSTSTSDSVTYDVPNQNQPHNNNHHHHHQNSALRKYVLLIQDCVAIRFSRDRNNGVSEKQRRGSSLLDPNQKYPDIMGSNDHHFSRTHGTESPLDGVTLFKAFISSNKKCYWNPPLCEAISSLEYKGYVHPSTVLVCTTNRHMNVLRNAWSRRILRDPPGFRADFLGEIEELVAQPVQQGQFAPLSDSLCWAIAELTETGQEAFIDSIQVKLTQSIFTQPPKELIFQTLEKLIREQKIYQTSHGYYVVTPDISTFINYSRSVTPAAAHVYGRIYSDCFDKLSTSRYSTPYASTPSVAHHDPVAEELRRILSNPPNRVHLKRHNSLKIIRNKQENYHIHQHPSMGARSLSFRLSKCNSLFESDKETDEDDDRMAPKPPPPPPPPPPTSTEKHIPTENQCIPTHQNIKKKRPSFFTRLFTFRCTSRRQKPTVLDPTQTKKWNSLPTTLPPDSKHPTPPPEIPEPCNPRQRQRPTQRRRSTRTRPISPSSSVSGIYASITQREQQQKINVSSTTSKATARSLYDLLSDHHQQQRLSCSSWQEVVKHDSSDVSH